MSYVLSPEQQEKLAGSKEAFEKARQSVREADGPRYFGGFISTPSMSDIDQARAANTELKKRIEDLERRVAYLEDEPRRKRDATYEKAVQEMLDLDIVRVPDGSYEGPGTPRVPRIRVEDL